MLRRIVSALSTPLTRELRRIRGRAERTSGVAAVPVRAADSAPGPPGGAGSEVGDDSPSDSADPRPRGAPPAALEELSLGEYRDVWDAFVDVRPSYVHKLHEAKRRHGLLRRHLGRPHPMWLVNSKTAGYRFARSLGIDHPLTLAAFDDIATLDIDGFGSRFLVKPVQGSANRGVFGLVTRPGGGYDDLLSGERVELDEVVTSYTGHVEAGRISARGVVEELLSSPEDPGSIPDDWKVYVFGGRATVTMQRRTGSRDRSQWRFKFWTRGWSDLGAVKYHDRIDPDLPPPTRPEELTEAADRMGRELGLPFIRLDFYDTDRGVVFGEVSSHPGPPEVWDPEIDELLGRHWELAEAHMTATDIAAGRWSQLERFR